MKIAVTGGTGFLGTYIVRHLANAGHFCRCWRRAAGHPSGLLEMTGPIEWVTGQLADARAPMAEFVGGCDALVHSALDRPGTTFRGGEGDLETFVSRNVLGTIRLLEAAKAANVGRVVFISTCGVYEQILDDRPLDETHPLWPASHYGAHKAAIDAFVHSYGLSGELPVCSLRPCGIYGLAQPVHTTRWYSTVQSIVENEPVMCQGGTKVVHAHDVARAVEILLTAPAVAGQAYNCCDRYVSDWDVAHLAKEIAGSSSVIHGQTKVPKHHICTDKMESLGLTFGGETLLRETVSQLVSEIQ